MRRSGTMGVLIPQRLTPVFANPFVSELVQGLGEQCEEHDLTLLLVAPLDGSLESAIRQASVDGFISLGLSPDDKALRLLDRNGIPTVLVGSDPSPELPVVNVDDRGGAEEAARHLLELGHTQLAIIVLPPTRSQLETTPTAARRMAGYEAAIAGAGAPAPECVTAGISVEAGARAVHQLREGGRRPPAGVALGRQAAGRGMSPAPAPGVRAPADLSGVRFDELPPA